MNGDQFPTHLWFLHEEYYGLYNTSDIIMRDSDFASVFYILQCMEKYHSARPFNYFITYVGNDIPDAKRILNEYQDCLDHFCSDENIMVASYVKNFL